MRRLGLAWLPIVALMSSAPWALAQGLDGPRAHVKVTPASGSRRTPFSVRFVNPIRTGTTPDLSVSETISVKIPMMTRATKCLSRSSWKLKPSAAGATIELTLSPGVRGWCAGEFSGAVTEYRSIICPSVPHQACPEIAFAPVQLGSFRFTVRRASS